MSTPSTYRLKNIRETVIVTHATPRPSDVSPRQFAQSTASLALKLNSLSMPQSSQERDALVSVIQTIVEFQKVDPDATIAVHTGRQPVVQLPTLRSMMQQASVPQEVRQIFNESYAPSSPQSTPPVSSRRKSSSLTFSH